MKLTQIESVLVLEDDVDLLNILVAMIGRHFKSVRSVTTAEEAYKMIHASEPDLLVVDIKLPGMSGVDFVAKIRSEGYASPAIICSAMAGIRDLKRALALGVCDFIDKPFRSETIETVLFRFIEIQRKQLNVSRILMEEDGDLTELKRLKKQISMHQAASAHRLSE